MTQNNVEVVKPDENEEVYVVKDAPILLTTVRTVLRKGFGWLFNWARSHSPWLLYLGIKCCAIEIPMAAGAPRFDMERWGVFPPSSPRQADVMVVNGPITKKYAQVIKTLYDQMPEPKYIVAVGECAIIGGPFKNSYNIIPGVDKVIPVDIYIPGCPPRPEAYLNALNQLKKLVKRGRL